MKWINTAFQFKDVAELCRNEMNEASIRADMFFSYGKWYVAWMPTSNKEYEIGIHIVCKHIW